MARKKALIIGINYTGTSHELKGCVNDAYNVRDFLVGDRGFSPEQQDMVILTDEESNSGTPFWPSRENLMAAFKWLARCNDEGDSIWLSYSGHGGQTRDLEGTRASGYDDTICPVDFQEAGQINSTILHKAIVSPMHPRARLTILFDCCHSGSACELPYIFRPDADGNVNIVDTIKQGMNLLSEAEDLVRRGFSMDKMTEARELWGGASSFFHSLHDLRNGGGGADEEGLAAQATEWADEDKDVWMFSGCADDQTSADASIGGANTGAMSWAFIGAMRENPDQSYIQILQNTRESLVNKYSQVPQLSCGGHYDLDQAFDVRRASPGGRSRLTLQL